MKIILRSFNQVISDLGKHFETTTDIFQAERVVLWNDVMPTEKSIIEFAHSLKKPVIVVQHGRHGTSRYYPPFNEPILADKLCVWGERDKKVLVDNNHPAKKIEVCGSPIFFYLKPRIKHEGINIVFLIYSRWPLRRLRHPENIQMPSPGSKRNGNGKKRVLG